MGRVRRILVRRGSCREEGSVGHVKGKCVQGGGVQPEPRSGLESSRNEAEEACGPVRLHEKQV